MPVYKDNKQILGERCLDIPIGQVRKNKRKTRLNYSKSGTKAWGKRRNVKAARCLQYDI